MLLVVYTDAIHTPRNAKINFVGYVKQHAQIGTKSTYIGSCGCSAVSIVQPNACYTNTKNGFNGKTVFFSSVPSDFGSDIGSQVHVGIKIKIAKPKFKRYCINPGTPIYSVIQRACEPFEII